VDDQLQIGLLGLLVGEGLHSGFTELTADAGGNVTTALCRDRTSLFGGSKIGDCDDPPLPDFHTHALPQRALDNDLFLIQRRCQGSQLGTLAEIQLVGLPTHGNRGSSGFAPDGEDSSSECPSDLDGFTVVCSRLG
jgi:hypothetical protein